MFCDKCGKRVAADAQFCAGCGAPILGRAAPSPSKPHDDRSPLVLRPVFLPVPTLLAILALAAFVSTWAGGFLGVVGFMLIAALKLSIPPYVPFVLGSGLIFLIFTSVAFPLRKKSYRKIEYRFFPDRVEYTSGLWTINKETLPYSKVADVTMVSGPFQKPRGLGTITLKTIGGSGASVSIRNIAEPDHVYDLVREMVLNR